MEWGRFASAGLLSGAVLFGVGFAFHLAVPAVAPGVAKEYERQELFRPWGGWTGWYMLAHPWLYGFAFAAVFLALRATVGPDRLGGPTHGLLYGVALFVVGSLPVYALNYASLQLSAGVFATWVIQSLCQYVLAGWALGALFPRPPAG